MKTILSEALMKILQHTIADLKQESVPLEEARGRINAIPVRARYFVPPYDISLRDGVALPAGMLERSSIIVSHLPTVMTGSRVPHDCVSIIESEKITGETISAALLGEVREAGDFIKPKGEDIKEGEILIKTGDIISSFDIANLASQGISEVVVYKKIKIAYIGVGDDLVDISQQLQEGKIYNSNAYTIATRGKVLGALAKEISHVGDDVEALKEKLTSFQDCDAVVTIGGMSRGDTVDRLLEDDMLKTIFKGVALAPAGLSAFSFLGSMPILHLPGLPLSALLGFEILGTPMISRLYGQDFNANGGVNTVTSEDIKYQSSSQSIVPGFFDGNRFIPTKAQAGMMNVLNHCNGYILSPITEKLQEGDEVKFHPFTAWNS